MIGFCFIKVFNYTANLAVDNFVWLKLAPFLLNHPVDIKWRTRILEHFANMPFDLVLQRYLVRCIAACAIFILRVGSDKR